MSHTICPSCGAYNGSHSPRCPDITLESAKAQLLLYFDEYQKGFVQKTNDYKQREGQQAANRIKYLQQQVAQWQAKAALLKAENNSLRRKLKV